MEQFSMPQNRDKFLICPKCPNKIFTNKKAVETHKLKHEHPRFYENTNEKISATQSKVVQLTSYPDLSSKKDEQYLKFIASLNGKTIKNKQRKSSEPQNQVIELLIMKKILTVQWNCKFCESSKYDNEQAAVVHVHEEHYNLTENDLIKRVQIIKRKRTIDKWICKICNTSSVKQKKVTRCFSKHGALLDHSNPQLKSKMLISYLVFPKYTCMLCKEEVGCTKAVQNHMSQKHINIFSEYFCDFEYPQPIRKQSEISGRVTCDEKIIIKDVLEQIGITKFSKTTGLQWHSMKQLPTELYSCAFCPHTVIFQQAEIPYHMWSKHSVKENYDKLVASIPLELIMECSDIRYIVINCPCQYTSFSREILSMPLINMLYYGIPNKSIDDNIDAEIKLMKIYKAQFLHHNIYRLKIDPKYKERIRIVPGNIASNETLEKIIHFKHMQNKNKESCSLVPGNTASNENPEKMIHPQHTQNKNKKRIRIVPGNIASNENPEKIIHPQHTQSKNYSGIITDDISDFQPNYKEITVNENLIVRNITFEDVENTEDFDDTREDKIMDLFKLSDEEETNEEQSDGDLKIEIYIDELDDIKKASRDDLLVMKDFLQKGGITDERSLTQSRKVQKVPKEVYSCFLCPHLTIFSSDELKFHMNTEHKLTEDYSSLISVVPVKSLIQTRFVSEDEVLLSCLCKYSSFTKRALSMPVIDRIYEEIIKSPKELKYINSEMKLLRIYQHNFTNHYTQKLIVVIDDIEKKRKLV